MKQLASASCSSSRSPCSHPGPSSRRTTSKVKAATGQVESGAKKIPDGKIGAGIEETTKGIGNTVSEGAKYSGEKLKEAAKAAEPPARTVWGNARDGAVAFGHSVEGFFTNLFSN